MESPTLQEMCTKTTVGTTTLPGSWLWRQAMHLASSFPGNAMPLAGPDVLVVMCIGGGVTQEVTALQISTR